MSCPLVGEILYGTYSRPPVYWLTIRPRRFTFYLRPWFVTPVVIESGARWGEVPELATIAPIAEVPGERRRVPRIPFKATSVVAEVGSTQVVVAQTSELSRYGCFVKTIQPYPQGTRVHIEMAEGGTTFSALGVVAYVAGDGMGVIFSMVEPEDHEILAKWLSRSDAFSERYGIGATAEVKELGSWNEQVVITRDLSACGCFVETAVQSPKGSQVRVRITHRGEEFTAIGRVTDNIRPDGMGLEFVEMEPKDRAILKKWPVDEKQSRP